MFQFVQKLTAPVTKYGYFNPWIWVGTAFITIGGGVLTTFDVQTTTHMINGIQVLAGLGSAAVIQMVSPLNKLYHLHVHGIFSPLLP